MQSKDIAAPAPVANISTATFVVIAAISPNIFISPFQNFRFFQELFRLQAQRLLLLQSRVQTKQLPFVSPPFIVIYNKQVYNVSLQVIGIPYITIH